MATIIRKNSAPSAPPPKKRGGLIAALLLLAAAFGCGIIYKASGITAALILGFVALAAGVITLVITVLFGGASPSGSAEAKRYGDRGERATGSILERYLPDDYTVIQNAKIRYGGGVSETDNIIVGRTGVFVVEVKNIKGRVSGSYADKNWLQNKTDRYGIAHQKEFYSPVRQIGTHIWRLANLLRDNKIFTHVSGAVYFANPKTSVFLRGEPNDIPVFTYRTTQELLDYIKSGNANLSDGKIQKIIQLLQ